MSSHTTVFEQISSKLVMEILSGRGGLPVSEPLLETTGNVFVSRD